MDFLKEWVRGLVMLVLLSTCLEMLLPMGSMKRYVRMAMGFLVVLAVTKPIFGFLGQPLDVDLALFAKEESRHLPTMGEIMAKATEFQKRNSDLVGEQARTGLEAEAADAAKQVSGVADARAVVTLTEGAIKAVALTIRSGGGQSSVPKIQPVQPVQPVTPGGAPNPAPGAATHEPASVDEKALAQKVREAVAARLGLSAGSIQIRLESHGR